MTVRLKITQVKSLSGKKRNQRATLRSLGLGKIGDVAAHTDGAVIRGMADIVGHLVTVEKVG